MSRRIMQAVLFLLRPFLSSPLCRRFAPNVAGHVVPRAFMVSDQGMVMDRSKMWAQSSNPYYCNVTEAVPGKILPAVCGRRRTVI